MDTLRVHREADVTPSGANSGARRKRASRAKDAIARGTTRRASATAKTPEAA